MSEKGSCCCCSHCEVKIILIDHHHHQQQHATFLQTLLYQKFQNQIKGFVRWFNRRETFLNSIQNNSEDDDEYTTTTNNQNRNKKKKNTTIHFIPKSFSSLIDREETLKKEMGFLPIEFSLDGNCLIAFSLVSKLFSLPEQMCSSWGLVEWNDFKENLLNDSTLLVEEHERMILTSLFMDQNETELFERLPDELKYSKEFVGKAVEMCGTVIKYLTDHHEELLGDREIIVKAVMNSPISLLENLPEKYLDDEEIVLKSCSLCPDDASLISPRLMGDETFLLKLVERIPQAFASIPSRLKNDSNFVRKCLERAGTRLFDLVPNKVLEPIVIDDDINELKSISSKCFISDYFVRALAKCYTMEIAGKIRSDLSNDREFAYECISNQPTCASFFSSEIRNEREFIKLSKNLNIAADKTQLDSEFLKEMYRIDIQNFHYLPQEFKENKSFVLELMEINGLGLEFLSNSLRMDLSIVSRAIQQNGSALYSALAKERRNRKLQELATETNGYFEYHNSDEKTFRKHLRLRLDKEYFGFDIPKRFCTCDNSDHHSNDFYFLVGSHEKLEESF